MFFNSIALSGKYCYYIQDIYIHANTLSVEGQTKKKKKKGTLPHLFISDIQATKYYSLQNNAILIFIDILKELNFGFCF